MSTRKTLAAVAPLFLVLFIDGMGLSLLFPVLNGIIIDAKSTFLPAATSIATRDLLYGLIVGIFMICWFFGAAILGDLSDTVGRKKSLLICLIGAFLGYLLSAVAVVEQSLTFIIVGRIIAGFTAGSQPIAQAAIVDVSAPEHKARNIGLILLAISIGFIAGPIIGGALSDSRVVSWFNFSTPLYFAAIISLINAFLLMWMFKETFQQKGKIRIRFHHAINIFISAFRHKKVRALSVVFFIMIYGWSNYFTFISMYSLHQYNFTPLKVSLSLAVMGVGFSIGTGILVDFFTRRFRLKNVVVVSLFTVAVVVFMMLVFRGEAVFWASLVFAGMAMAVGYSALITMFSDQVGPEEQGWVMGVTGSVMALCFGLTSFFTGYLANFGASIPMYLAAGGLALSAIIMIAVRSNHDKNSV